MDEEFSGFLDKEELQDLSIVIDMQKSFYVLQLFDKGLLERKQLFTVSAAPNRSRQCYSK